MTVNEKFYTMTNTDKERKNQLLQQLLASSTFINMPFVHADHDVPHVHGPSCNHGHDHAENHGDTEAVDHGTETDL